MRHGVGTKANVPTKGSLRLGVAHEVMGAGVFVVGEWHGKAVGVLHPTVCLSGFGPRAGSPF